MNLEMVTEVQKVQLTILLNLYQLHFYDCKDVIPHTLKNLINKKETGCYTI